MIMNVILFDGTCCWYDHECYIVRGSASLVRA